MPDAEIVAAILVRGDELLMVRQAGSGEEPYWSVPGGRVEAGESVAAALAREVREETGLTVVDEGRCVCSGRVLGPEGRVHAVSTWEFGAWKGALAPSDPDGFVLEAAWVPLAEAVERLAQVAWMADLVRFVRAGGTSS